MTIDPDRIELLARYMFRRQSEVWSSLCDAENAEWEEWVERNQDEWRDEAKALLKELAYWDALDDEASKPDLAAAERDRLRERLAARSPARQAATVLSDEELSDALGLWYRQREGDAVSELDEFFTELRSRIDECAGSLLDLSPQKSTWVHTPQQIGDWLDEAITAWRDNNAEEETA